MDPKAQERYMSLTCSFICSGWKDAWDTKEIIFKWFKKKTPWFQLKYLRKPEEGFLLCSSQHWEPWLSQEPSYSLNSSYPLPLHLPSTKYCQTPAWAIQPDEENSLPKVLVFQSQMAQVKLEPDNWVNHSLEMRSWASAGQLELEC